MPMSDQETLDGARARAAAAAKTMTVPFIAIGLAGKLLGPAGWILTVAGGEWPVRTITLILFNDVIWWVPFSLFLLDGDGAFVAASTGEGRLERRRPVTWKRPAGTNRSSCRT